ncbi:Asp-tRNA(Asn)/Glu-tRNA(Gln) amidotransferase GatCAB subunit C [bacterium]|nr:Asp-tRNA(Asn)/Glu-tRNA(Gln) amidotransferase GatCAB subunit C [bacterium]|tara:strand:- start:2 stop:295 length:294 start_codon:yes stop_codon:yes gene_type:complete
MTKKEVQHLARLSRIAITDEEAETFTKEIDAILEYVSEVTEVAGTDALEPTVGAVHNVFRADEVTNEPNQYTDALLAAMPETDGRFMSVKKILNQDD